MEQLLERARAYLDTLEADRQALTLSEQKADEAKLIKARKDFERPSRCWVVKLLPAMSGQVRTAKSRCGDECVGPYAK